MLSEDRATKFFAKINQDQEILLWRYATETSDFQKLKIGLHMLSLKVKNSLRGIFYSVASVRAIEDYTLRYAAINARALSPYQAVKRTLAMRTSIRDWEKAKQHNDFSLVQDSLQKMVDSIRIEARNKARDLGIAEPYDALLESRTPGLSTEYFDWLTEKLPTFCYIVRKQAKSLQASAYPQDLFKMDGHSQKKLETLVLQSAGYDIGKGHVKDAQHPLCMGMHDDVRIGVRASDDFTTIMLTAGHEGGHGAYRQNLPDDKSLRGQLAGVGMDETMALLMENHVVRDRPYLAHVAKTLRTEFNDAALAYITGDMLHRHMKHIDNTTSRTEADEIRYPLDVILRYRIERKLVNGEMDAADIPAFWRSEYKKLTGIEIKGDNEGVLQDIHWFAGEFGWFPNYLVGQMAAAQIFEVASEDMPFLPQYLERGNTAPLKNWLHEKIYSHGATKTMFDIIHDISGATVGPIAYMRHIGRRYTRKDESKLELCKFDI